MLVIHCPYCGPRPEPEFAHGGQAHVARPQDPTTTTEDDLLQYLYLRENPRGLFRERWRHARGCGRLFNAIRDTTTDFFVTTYKVGERPELPGGAA